MTVSDNGIGLSKAGSQKPEARLLRPGRHRRARPHPRRQVPHHEQSTWRHDRPHLDSRRRQSARGGRHRSVDAPAQARLRSRPSAVTWLLSDAVQEGPANTAEAIAAWCVHRKLPRTRPGVAGRRQRPRRPRCRPPAAAPLPSRSRSQPDACVPAPAGCLDPPADPFQHLTPRARGVFLAQHLDQVFFWRARSCCRSCVCCLFCLVSNKLVASFFACSTVRISS